MYAAAALLLGPAETLALQQPDVLLAPYGGEGGNTFHARCAAGEHLMGVNLRAGHDVDAVQPICGSAASPTGPMTPGAAPPWFGGAGGDPKQVICPARTPVVHAMSVAAEGRPSAILNGVAVFCGIAGLQRHLSEVPSATFEGPSQNLFIPAPFINKRCPEGLVAVGVHGRAGARVDALGLICGTPQLRSDPTAGRTLGKRKRPTDDTEERTLNKRKLPGGADRGATSQAVGAIEARYAWFDELAGRYQLSSGHIITLSREGSRLLAEFSAAETGVAPGQHEIVPVEREAPTGFGGIRRPGDPIGSNLPPLTLTDANGRWTLEFRRALSGKYEALTFISASARQNAVRLN